jgi:K+-sensing histidine kinase KdpD
MLQRYCIGSLRIKQNKQKKEESFPSLKVSGFRNHNCSLGLNYKLAENIFPEVVIVDELAHTNMPGSKNEKRWQDVIEILDASTNVISAVNIQHIESINDEVRIITGIEVS